MTNEQVLGDIAAMQRHLPDAGLGDLGMWDELCARHAALIALHGFDMFKRTVNFEYSQWGVSGFRDPKILALLRLAARHHGMIGSLLRVRMGERPGASGVWPIGRVRWRHLAAYRLYVSLLHAYASRTDALGCLQEEEPSVGAPLDIRYGGRLISQDLCLSTLELSAISRHCDIRSVRRVAELGAGYGRLAWLVARVATGVEYHVYDIPPALAIAQNYLRATLGSERVVPFGSMLSAQPSESRVVMRMPDALEQAPDGGFELFINVSSLDEMPPAAVERYFSLIDRKTKGILYLKGYRKNLRTAWDVREFPYRPRWQRLWYRTDPVNPLFVEQLYRIP